MFDVTIKLPNQPWEKAQLSIDEHQLTFRIGIRVEVLRRNSVRHFCVLKNNRIGLYEENTTQLLLELEYPNIKGLLLSQWPELSEKKTRKSIVNLRLLTVLGLAVGVLLVLFAVLYFGVLPFMKRTLVNQVPKQREIEMGKEFYSQIIKQERPDSIASLYLNDFASEINFHTSYPLHFTVLSGKTVNAFALPGGEILVYKGMISQIKTPAQLAALLAHEASHVHYRHSLNNLADNVMWNMLLMMIMGDGGMGAVLADKGNELRSLSYSRDLETQSDTAGVSILVKNGIHPMGMKELMLILKNASQDAHAVPEFVQTHPLPDSRIATIESAIQRITALPQSEFQSEAFNMLKASAEK